MAVRPVQAAHPALVALLPHAPQAVLRHPQLSSTLVCGRLRGPCQYSRLLSSGTGLQGCAAGHSQQTAAADVIQHLSCRRNGTWFAATVAACTQQAAVCPGIIQSSFEQLCLYRTDPTCTHPKHRHLGVLTCSLCSHQLLPQLCRLLLRRLQFALQVRLLPAQLLRVLCMLCRGKLLLSLQLLCTSHGCFHAQLHPLVHLQAAVEG